MGRGDFSAHRVRCVWNNVYKYGKMNIKPQKISGDFGFQIIKLCTEIVVEEIYHMHKSLLTKPIVKMILTNDTNKWVIPCH